MIYEPELIDVYEAGERYGLKVGTIHQWIRRGKLARAQAPRRHIPNGRPRILVDVKALQSLLTGRQRSQSSPS